MYQYSKLFILSGLAAILMACTPSYHCSDCSETYNTANEKPSVVNCRQWFSDISDTVAKMGVTDDETAKIASFPYLRIDRFYASFSHKSLSPTQFSAWVDGLQDLGDQAWDVQLANLPVQAQVDLYSKQLNYFGEQPSLLAATRRCSQILRDVDLKENARREQLISMANVASFDNTSESMDEFTTQWQKSVKKSFQAGPEGLKPKGQLQRYMATTTQTLTQQQVATILRNSANNALQIPQPTTQQLNALFANFAPVWEIDTVSNSDRIGEIYWPNKKHVAVSTQTPIVYVLPSYADVKNKILLQLNYMIWFPKHTASGDSEALSGDLDGIIWRVTLAPNGTVLVSDTIHSCGCYHLFFPSYQLKTNKETAVFIPKTLPNLRPNQPMVVRVSSNDHQIESVYPYKPNGTEASHYQTQAYQSLLSLPYPNRRQYSRSMFTPTGLAQGTERSEQFALWPTEIPAPGVVRQWGHQAMIMTGDGYFDDPYLISRYFD